MILQELFQQEIRCLQYFIISFLDTSFVDDIKSMINLKYFKLWTKKVLVWKLYVIFIISYKRHIIHFSEIIPFNLRWWIFLLQMYSLKKWEKARGASKHLLFCNTQALLKRKEGLSRTRVAAVVQAGLRLIRNVLNTDPKSWFHRWWKVPECSLIGNLFAKNSSSRSDQHEFSTKFYFKKILTAASLSCCQVHIRCVLYGRKITNQQKLSQCHSCMNTYFKFRGNYEECLMLKTFWAINHTWKRSRMGKYCLLRQNKHSSVEFKS